MNFSLNQNIFKIVAEVAKEQNLEVFAIGGYVRDLILGRNNKDVDFVVVGSGIDFACRVAQKINPKIKVAQFKNFGTAMFRYDDCDIEFVGARKESYSRDSRNPVVENGTIEDDHNRRDFTINAMAISLNRETYGQLVDPFDGIGDLNRKIIRTSCDPDITFSDDPLRMLRAVRFATQLGFNIAPETFASIKRNIERLDILSVERITVEIEKIIMSPRPSVGFKALSASGLLQIILPEVENLHGVENKEGYRHKDNFYHSLEVLDNISLSSDNLWLRWAALLHDIGKKATKRFDENLGWTFHGHEYKGSKMAISIFKRLKLPMNQRLKYVQKMICLHMRPIVLAHEIITDSAVRRLLFEAGDDIDDLMLLCDADITSKNQEKVYQFLNNYQLVRQKLKDIEEKDIIRNFQPPVSGELIMQTFGLQPSKEVGNIKDAIKEAILEGTIENNFDAALNYMYLKAAELGIEKNTN